MLITIVEFGTKLMIHPLTCETAIASHDTVGILHATHGVIHEVRIGLYRGDIGYLLLAAVVIATDAKGVIAEGEGGGRGELIVEQFRA